jgi:hypothetical protein
MAQIPVPRSYPAILGDMINAFLSRYGIKKLKVGSPLLSILEAAAQSDLRGSQDVFNMLNAASLDRASGVALDRIGADEDVLRFSDTIATGLVTVSDTSITKKATKVYQGLPAPIVGTTTLNVADASTFPASGSLYLGRGTVNFEGPIAYSATANIGAYWTITLSSATQKFHNLNESVILAQGGTRNVTSGTIVQTLQGNVSDAVQFATVYAASIPDGETSVSGVLVAAKKPGVIGNVQAGTIVNFVSAPFTGAAVANPLPFSNATAAEVDGDYRNRIKQARQTRSKGTALAIQTSVIGVIAQDENKRVTSSSIVTREGSPATLYIDDGTGYEESTVGIAIENLTDSALGGEQYFQFAAPRKSITKAFVKSTLTAPFKLVVGATLNVKVGGTLSIYTFASSDFKAISNATAYEVSAAINSSATLTFSARTAEGGTKVVLFAKADTNESIEVLAATTGTDANTYLGFSTGRVDTVKLYKNDRLLSKDGASAIIASNPQSGWTTMTTGETLTISVDGCAAQTYTFTDADFISGGTGYTTLSATNSLTAWATVINNKIPGVTATVGTGLLYLTSNLITSSRAALSITGGSLITKSMFTAAAGLSATGASQDFTLNRNTGRMKLSSGLVAGDKLSAGTFNTRAFLQSSSFSTVNVSNATGQVGARLWFVVDGSAQVISTGINGALTLTASNQTPAATRWRFTSSVLNVFTNVQVNDWVIHWDTNFHSTNLGFWRVAAIDTTNFSWYEIDRPTASNTAGINLSANGVVFVRTTASLQQVIVPTGNNYTPTTIAAQLSLKGAVASVYQTTYVRVYTNTYRSTGDIALVAQDTQAQVLGFIPNVTPVTNLSSHIASVESANEEAGTPTFLGVLATAVTAPYTSVFTPVAGALANQNIHSNSQVTILKSLPVSGSNTRTANNRGSGSIIQAVNFSSGQITLRNALASEMTINDRYFTSYSPYSIAPDDDLTVVVDGDTASKRFYIPMFRRIKPTTTTYGSTNTFVDLDNSNQPLGQIFGTTFDFRDFVVYMKPRAKTSRSGGVDTTATILWRYYKHGAASYFNASNNAGLSVTPPAIRYSYPPAASLTVAVSQDNTANAFPVISVQLPSGAARGSVPAYKTNTRIGLVISGGGGSNLYTYSYIHNFLVSSATRAANVTTLTLTLPLTISDHKLIIGDVIYLNSTDGNFTSGAKTITSVAATTIAYSDVAANAGPIANIGTVSNNPQGELTFSGATVIVGDIVRVESSATFSVGDGSNFGSAYANKTMKISALTNQYFSATSDTNLGLDANAANNGLTIIWRTLGDSAAFSYYPINSASNQAGQIATAVNALAAADVKVPITAVAVGNGSVSTGTITQSSYDFNNNNAYSDFFADSQNAISTSTYSSDYSLTFKDTAAVILAGTNCDWSNEEIRLVPSNALTAVAYLNAALSGLFQASSIIASSRAGKVQISSATAGSTSSVQVQGGTASAASATIVGGITYSPPTGTFANKYGTVQVPKTTAQGFYGGQWVALVNSITMPKNTFDSSTNLSNIFSTGWLVFNAGGKKPFTAATASLFQNGSFQIEKHGRFVSYTYSGVGSAPVLTGLQEGDWIFFGTAPAWTTNTTYALNAYVTAASGNTYKATTGGVSASSGAGPTGVGSGIADNTAVWAFQYATPSLSPSNRGYFRVVRVDAINNAVWVENTNVVEEVATADFAPLVYDSVIPGDIITINGAWGDSNIGNWTVSQLDIYGTYQGPTNVSFQVTGTRNLTAGTPGVLGASNANLVICREGTATRMIKQIANVALNQSNSDYVDVRFNYSSNNNSVTSNGAGSRNITPIAGTIMQALDKFAFPAATATGIDGYTYSAGLIGEVNRTIYGDRQDPAAYPGVVAEGANVNISGPVVRRIQIALLIRARAGVSTQDISDRVKSTVASVVNKTGVGTSIALSDIVAAATQINGVVSVTILSPAYTSTSDLISIQPVEKPLVLSLDSDITVTFTT